MNTAINIYDVLILLFIHWVADFIMQTDGQAKGKSTNWGDLLSHTLTYSLAFIPIMVTVSYHYDNYKFFWFIPITFIAHTCTDYYTSRVNSMLWKEGKVHDFFVSVGFDQFLHFAQILITFQLLK